MDVKILNWPSDAAERERYRELGIPRILVLQPGQVPPLQDALEEWVAPPIEPTDLWQRVSALRARALAGVPIIDSAEILRFAGLWAPLPDLDAKLMRVFIAHYQSLVRREDLIQECWPEGPSSRNALDLRMLRLRRRIEPLHLVIRTVWGKGYMLDVGENDRGAL